MNIDGWKTIMNESTLEIAWFPYSICSVKNDWSIDQLNQYRFDVDWAIISGYGLISQKVHLITDSLKISY